MYVIVVYDVDVKRVGKVMKFLRTYLNWIQNSVFEGELTEGQFYKMKNGLSKIIKGKEDSVIIFRMPDDKFVEKTIMGIEKNPTDNLI
ncbi:CRISPR-associated endonuclease Cas2 [Calorimonas adulescens]|jgi:CRISPR-associated protein, Cas2 family|uniref:CRISPR-associated endoribonuclease Cas2 n=1 Tax=Calorimonas adulescens TaxID=2606906 RepID=A0A5D8QBS4_9THEO|nr:CRISPR-associated endonuclease Cas2 [Calorimonas adulescens]TZE81599.1 CRISPR-associated endonuclease Cas2 [Calorimonas adulescens]